jgi:glycopeptide antibiotics resistance protein
MASNPFGEVPALPVAVLFGVVVLVVQLVFLLRGGRFSWPRTAVAAVIAVYAAGIFANTVFPIVLNPATSAEPWSPALALIPFHDYEVDDALTNVVVFVPLGILIPLLMRRPQWWKVLLTAVMVSLTIELVQLAAQRLFSGGHVADVNDFIWNTAGGVVGYAIFAVLSRVPLLAAILGRFRWHATDMTAQTPPDRRSSVR